VPLRRGRSGDEPAQIVAPVIEDEEVGLTPRELGLDVLGVVAVEALRERTDHTDGVPDDAWAVVLEDHAVGPDRATATRTELDDVLPPRHVDAVPGLVQRLSVGLDDLRGAAVHAELELPTARLERVPDLDRRDLAPDLALPRRLEAAPRPAFAAKDVPTEPVVPVLLAQVRDVADVPVLGLDVDDLAAVVRRVAIEQHEPGASVAEAGLHALADRVR